METIVKTNKIPAAQAISHLNPADVSLSAGQTYPIHDTRQPVKIKCEKGILWITRMNDLHDHLVRAGETYTLEGGSKRAVAQGLTDARFKFVMN